ncbi:unnamed protein product [Rhizoctonia solani]|uniref:Uncharacterized protein n=1 Tax=Rhizoctonia solani TaxID=456999 RepID=A0A8H3CVH6_9AGAM|nr:unnamed protein product [Rhizoctonia solani]
MPAATQRASLSTSNSNDPVDIIFIESDDDAIDKSESDLQGEGAPSPSFPGTLGNLKSHQSKVSPRRVGASQPIQSSRKLRPRNDIGYTLYRSSSMAQSSSSVNTRNTMKMSGKYDLSKMSVKRKYEEPEIGPRMRKKLSFSGCESEPTTSSEPIISSEPEPGRTSDGKIDYRYYIMKYLNQRD